MSQAARPTPGGFRHQTWPQIVFFASHAAAEHTQVAVDSLGARRALLIGSPRAVETIASLAPDLPVVHRCTRVAMHVPRPVVDDARADAARHGADVLIAVGGGSATGLAKAVAHDTGLPIIAIPSTYSGSEVTFAWGVTEGGHKRVGVDPAVLPAAVVYDPVLTLSLSPQLSAVSGLNALAHAVEAMWAPATDPVAQALALEAVRLLRDGLTAILRRPDDLPAREHALQGAYLAGLAFSTARSGLHHKICHRLGGSFDLPHAETHAVVLPHVMALNESADHHSGRRIAAALDAPTATVGICDLARRLDAPRSLRSLGLREQDLDAAARLCAESAPPSNPAQVDADVMRRLLRAAWNGEMPA